MKLRGVIALDTIYDEPIHSEFLTDDFKERAALTLPSSSITLTFDRVASETFRILTGLPPRCTYNQPALLPRPEFHVETVRVSPFARFGYMKQKMRRLARERYANHRS